MWFLRCSCSSYHPILPFSSNWKFPSRQLYWTQWVEHYFFFHGQEFSWHIQHPPYTIFRNRSVAFRLLNEPHSSTSGRSVRRMSVFFISAATIAQGSLAAIFISNGQLGKPCHIRNVAILVVKGLFRPTFIALGAVEIMLMLRVLAICKPESDLQVCCNNECYAYRRSQQGNHILSWQPFGVSRQLFEPTSDGSAVSRGVLYL